MLGQQKTILLVIIYSYQKRQVLFLVLSLPLPETHLNPGWETSPRNCGYCSTGGREMEKCSARVPRRGPLGLQGFLPSLQLTPLQPHWPLDGPLAWNALRATTGRPHKEHLQNSLKQHLLGEACLPSDCSSNTASAPVATWHEYGSFHLVCLLPVSLLDKLCEERCCFVHCSALGTSKRLAHSVSYTSHWKNKWEHKYLGKKLAGGPDTGASAFTAKGAIAALAEQPSTGHGGPLTPGEPAHPPRKHKSQKASPHLPEGCEQSLQLPCGQRAAVGQPRQRGPEQTAGRALPECPEWAARPTRLPRQSLAKEGGERCWLPPSKNIITPLVLFSKKKKFHENKRAGKIPFRDMEIIPHFYTWDLL